MTTALALGFANPSPAWHLISPLFPDKIGGRPAWLALKYLPRTNQLQCPTCSEPMAFLLQTLDWKQTHRAKCQTSGDNSVAIIEPDFTENDFILPEFDICSEMVDPEEDEPEVNEASDESDGDDAVSDGVTEKSDDELEALESIAKHETREESCLRKFKLAMSSEPDQVIRLQRGGQPLWLSKADPEPVVPCELCGAERIFEFQITPQLLHHLKLDRVNKASPDFGSLYIFTCSASCKLPVQPGATPSFASVEYASEVVIRQMIP